MHLCYCKPLKIIALLQLFVHLANTSDYKTRARIPLRDLMGTKEFLMPSVKKIVVFAVAYFITMPLLLCIHAETSCQTTPGGWAGCSCTSALNAISIYPSQYLALITLGLFSFAGYFWLLWLGVAINYIISCLIVYIWWSGPKD